MTGAVRWARSLFARCKQTMQHVLELQPDLTQHPLGLQVSANPTIPAIWCNYISEPLFVLTGL